MVTAGWEDSLFHQPLSLGGCASAAQPLRGRCQIMSREFVAERPAAYF